MQEDHQDSKSNQSTPISEETSIVSSSQKSIIVQEKPNFLKELSKHTEMMNSLIADIAKIDENWKHYEKSLAYGYYLNEIKKQITGKPLEIIKSLMNTGIGFKTDHNPNDPNCKYKDIYSDDIIKNCVVQAVMLGLRIHGNEFNILGGNFYATKEGLDRIVHSNPSLEEKVKDKVKNFRQDDKTGIWGITFEYSYKLKGESKVTEEVTVLVKGKQGNYDIPFDAVMGKAKRKLYKTVYNDMTQGFKLEDADDIDDIELEKIAGDKPKISQLGK